MKKFLFIMLFSSSVFALEKGYISAPGQAVEVFYELQDGVPIMEGDIEIEPKDDASEVTIYGVGRWVRWRRWPNKTIPYTIDPKIKDVAKIDWAIDHIMQNTQIKMVPRTNERDYVEFSYNGKKGGCNSFIGRKWGKQLIRVPEWCKRGNIVHEILHALGMQHEQTRWDRNKYVKINWKNISSGDSHNFWRIPFISWSYTSFDFKSIMLYSSYAFSANSKPTITKLDGTTFRANRSALSYLDRLTIARMYNYQIED